MLSPRLEERRELRIARSSQPLAVRDLSIPRRHIRWTTIRTWDVLYRTKPDSKGRVQEVRIKTLTRPSRTRTLRVAGGRKKFYAVKVQRPVQEVVIYAPEAVKVPNNNRKEAMGKKNEKTPEVTDDELKELESLEDLESDEDEADEAPTETKAKGGKGGKKKGKASKNADAEDDDKAGKKKSRSSGAQPGKSRAAANGKVGTAEIAAAGKCDARTLRMVLRKHEIPKDEESGRYEWDSLEDKTVKKILKLLKEGEAENVKNEGLQRLKDSKAEKDAAAKTDQASDDKKGGKDKKKGKKNKNK